ncbi:MAG TPA: S53 family peptidase [Terriglobia bacterium]|nr:S53 family peptidase [Terriglobia bacterium]
MAKTPNTPKSPKKPNLVPLPGSERHPRAGARQIGTPDPNEQIRVSIRLRPRTPFGTLNSSNALGATMPKDRRYLTREEFAARFGADPADVAKVEAFAHQHNLTVVEASLPRRTVVLSGTIANFSTAFGVTLAKYEHPEGTFRGRTGPIMVPADLAGVVQGVFGLDDRRQARPRGRGFRPIDEARQAGQAGFTPPQVAQLYNFPSGINGAGECIGILEFGGGYTSGDLNTYFQQLGLTPPQITAVSVDGVSNQPQPGSNSPDVEVDLDIEVAGAVAPGAQIVVYFGPFTEQGWVDVLSTAVNDTLHKPSVLSISWGFAEGNDIWSQQAIQSVDQSFQAAAAMGITICVASGDDGSRDQITDGLAHVDFPASSEYVLGCGGTTLQGSGSQISSEVVWNDGANGGATGGGVSDYIGLPSWQQSAKVPPSVNPGSHVGRGVPDVAANADPNTGYQVLSDGVQGVVGGTSAAAPLWAGLTALINQQLGKPVGLLNPLIYGSGISGAGFHDITSGSNDITGQIGGYNAGPGWDACTGWGSPNGSALAAALGGSGSASGSGSAGWGSASGSGASSAGPSGTGRPAPKKKTKPPKPRPGKGKRGATR